MLLLAAVLVAPLPSAISADLRARSPYLACGADLADRSIKSKRSAVELAAQAEIKCELLLEANVDTSLEALEQQRPEGSEMSELERLTERDRLRTRLKASLKTVVVNRVTVQRTATGR